MQNIFVKIFLRHLLLHHCLPQKLSIASYFQYHQAKLLKFYNFVSAVLTLCFLCTSIQCSLYSLCFLFKSLIHCWRFIHHCNPMSIFLHGGSHDQTSLLTFFFHELLYVSRRISNFSMSHTSLSLTSPRKILSIWKSPNDLIPIKKNFLYKH